MEWYTGVLKRYVEFEGRARRKEYWMFVLINALVAAGIGIVQGAIGLSDETGAGPLTGLYSLAVLLPSLAVAVRRLHDTDHSGWWMFLAFLPIIGWIVIFVFLVTDGDPMTNQYGPSPKYGMPAAAAPPVAQQTAPAGWMPDPTGRHEFRYWDGSKWTPNVSDAGVPSADPIG